MPKFLWLALATASCILPTAHATNLNTRNWVAIHIFDSLYPIDENHTFVDALNSTETTIQLYTKKELVQSVQRSLHSRAEHYGTRNSQGHYLLWLHF